MIKLNGKAGEVITLTSKTRVQEPPMAIIEVFNKTIKIKGKVSGVYYKMPTEDLAIGAIYRERLLQDKRFTHMKK